jgi:hypothetical protein
MSDTNNLIKDVAFDIISVITVWNLLNNSSSNNYNVKAYYNSYNFNFSYSPIYSSIIGTGFSIFVLSKYYK